MTGSCERDANGSARPQAGSVRLFAELRPGKKESCPVRQGISSTDKGVTDSYPAAGMTGRFSSSSVLALGEASALAPSRLNDCPSLVRAVVSRWSVHRRSGQRRGFGETAFGKTNPVRRPRADFTHGSPKVFRSQWLAAPFGRCRDGNHAIAFRLKEVLPPSGSSRSGWRERIWRQSAGPQQGIRQEHPAL